MKESEYLISRGWRPSPSSRGPAWENAACCFETIWPEGFSEPVYIPVRWLQNHCVSEQHDRDVSRRDEWLENCSRYGGP